MAARVQFDLCPETGVGCVLVNREQGLLKIDLMPEEATELKRLASAGDLVGARALLTEVDSAAAELDDDGLRALLREME